MEALLNQLALEDKRGIESRHIKLPKTGVDLLKKNFYLTFWRLLSGDGGEEATTSGLGKTSSDH
jgi:hypothetical protein